MENYENWCRSVIYNLDLEVNHIIKAFGLPPPINVLWMYRDLHKLQYTSSETLMIQAVRQECEEKYEATEVCVDTLKKPRGFWRRIKKRFSVIFREICCCGCATHHHKE